MDKLTALAMASLRGVAVGARPSAAVPEHRSPNRHDADQHLSHRRRLLRVELPRGLVCGEGDVNGCVYVNVYVNGYVCLSGYGYANGCGRG
jgi:hypothetical protein